VAVWIILILGIFVSILSSRAFFAIRFMERMEEDLKAYYIARGGVQIAQRLIEQDETPRVDGFGENWINSSYFYQHTVGEGHFTIQVPDAYLPLGAGPWYGLVDEDRKININTADPGILKNLVGYIGQFPEEIAQGIANAIVDWRDEDSDRREGGAEDYEYRSLSPSYEAKDAPFENLEELLFVRGVSPDLYQALVPYVTIYGSGKLNINTASFPALLALGLSEEAVYGMMTFRQGEDGMEGTSDDRTMASASSAISELDTLIPQEDITNLMELFSEEAITVQSEAFYLSMEAKTKRMEHPLQVSCVLNRDGEVMAWMQQ